MNSPQFEHSLGLTRSIIQIRQWKSSTFPPSGLVAVYMHLMASCSVFDSVSLTCAVNSCFWFEIDKDILVK